MRTDAFAFLSIVALLSTGCGCGSSTMFLPWEDRTYHGTEYCGAGKSTFAQLDSLDPDVLTVFVDPHYGRPIETLEVLVTFDVRVSTFTEEGGEVPFAPEAFDSTLTPFPFAEGKVVFLKDLGEHGQPPIAKHRWRLAWDLTWGAEGDGAFFLDVHTEDAVEAFLPH